MRFTYIGTRSTRGTTHLAAIACAISLVVGLAEAQEEGPVEKINEAAATATISVTPLRGGISAVMGSGGNITVLNGQQGKLLSDAGIAVSRPRVSAALLSISDTPVKYVIDSHYHWDHTDGNEWLHSQGATILAQRNTLKRVSTATRVDD